jgi:anti-anti-sigma factor
MERQVMTSTVQTVQENPSTHSEPAGELTERIGEQPLRVQSRTAVRAPQPVSPAKDRPLRSIASWTHTLVLEGELTHRSAHALEVEIEQLCEQGVTALTIDLRRLTRVDRVGVAVIAFRCRLCERRGYGLELIPGSQAVQREFTRAGVAELLPFKEGDQAVR